MTVKPRRDWLAEFRQLPANSAISADGPLGRSTADPIGPNGTNGTKKTSTELAESLLASPNPSTGRKSPQIPPNPGIDAEWDAEDWQVFYDERAAIRKYAGGLPRAEAETLAHEDCITEWLIQHPERSDSDRCVWCGGLDQAAWPLVPCGAEDQGHVWLHPFCWAPWFERRKKEAAAALAKWVSTLAGKPLYNRPTKGKAYEEIPFTSTAGPGQSDSFDGSRKTGQTSAAPTSTESGAVSPSSAETPLYEEVSILKLCTG